MFNHELKIGHSIDTLHCRLNKYVIEVKNEAGLANQHSAKSPSLIELISMESLNWVYPQHRYACAYILDEFFGCVGIHCCFVTENRFSMIKKKTSLKIGANKYHN